VASFLCCRGGGEEGEKFLQVEIKEKKNKSLSFFFVDAEIYGAFAATAL